MSAVVFYKLHQKVRVEPAVSLCLLFSCYAFTHTLCGEGWDQPMMLMLDVATHYWKNHYPPIGERGLDWTNYPWFEGQATDYGWKKS
jgi:hypothetical protein